MLLASLLCLAGCSGEGGDTETPGAEMSSPGDDAHSADSVGDDVSAETTEPYVWQIPAGFPEPVIPEDNPMNAQKVELGRYLFYDKRLSINEAQSCGSCHEQSRAFTDGLAEAVGTTGEVHFRNSMALVNVAYNSRLTWADESLDRLEDQALVPIFGDMPVEMGMAGNEALLVERLQAEARYQRLFPLAFPDDSAPLSVANVAKAIAAFQRTLISGTSPFDRYINGETDAISESAKRGLSLFFSERLECFHCHGGFNFTDSSNHANSAVTEFGFHNTGLYNLDGDGAYPDKDRGLFNQTGDPADMGRFRAPTLRNIALTAPYMHDGSVATLEDVLDHYAAGGRTIDDGPFAGVGSDSPLRSEFVVGFILTAQERDDVIAFLNSLTDDAFINDPRFSDPFSSESMPVVLLR